MQGSGVGDGEERGLERRERRCVQGSGVGSDEERREETLAKSRDL